MVIALVATLGLVASGCGDDKDDSSKSDSTSKPRESTTTTEDPGATETTAAAEVPFEEGVNQFRSEIADAKGDLCSLAKVFATISIAEPQTPDEVKAAVDVISEWLTASADASGSSGDVLRSAAQKLTAAAAAVNYDQSVFQDPAVASAFQDSISTVQTACPDAADGSSPSTP